MVKLDLSPDGLNLRIYEILVISQQLSTLSIYPNYTILESMPKFVRKIEVIGLYQRFDILQKFQPGVNIIYGVNGTGKTTIIHILANILNADYRRFLYLDFHSIQVWFDNNDSVKIIKEEKEEIKVLEPGDRRGKNIRDQFDNDLESSDLGFTKQEPLLSSAYFPAFRTMIEAWSSVEYENKIQASSNRELYQIPENLNHKWQVQTTKFARKLFGNFVPQLNYPSTLEIELNLSEDIKKIIINITSVYREILSQSFIDIFAALSTLDMNEKLEKCEVILEEIKSIFNEIQKYPLQENLISSTEAYTKLHEIIHSIQFDNNDSRQIIGILSIYRDSLRKIANTLKESFAEIERYLSAVNIFLDGKKVVYTEDITLLDSFIKIKFSDGSLFNNLSALSSGERQIVTLIYASSKMSQQHLVLIDEPEISLHIDWQRLLLSKMSEQLHSRQIIVCTHSPMIATDYEECLQELQLKPTNSKRWHEDYFNNLNDYEYLEDISSENKLENFDLDID